MNRVGSAGTTGERRRPTAVIAHPGAELYGSDRVMLETAAALVDRGWRVVVALPSVGPLTAALVDLGAEVTELDVPVLRKRVLRPRNLPGFAVGSLRALTRIGRLLKQVRPDVLYVSTLTVPVWILRARAMGVPVITHVHESERQAPRLLRAAIASPLRLSQRILVNSAFSRDSLTEVVPSLAARSVVLYNGVPGPGRVVAPRTGLDGGIHIAYVGRLSPRKGVDTAVDALKLLVDGGADASLDLVGSVFEGYEWYERQLHEQIRRLGLEDRVAFLGFRSSVWASLADADVAVVPSRLEEPFGNTAVEAVLAGRPVVVSDIGGLVEAIDGFDSALPVPADDPAALATALDAVTSHWREYADAAVENASLAADRYSTGRYRAAVADEIAGVAHRSPVLQPAA